MKRVVAVAVLATVGILVLTGCGAASKLTPPPDTLTTPAPGATPSATPGSTGFPKEATNPDPNTDMGYTVLITDSGFQPTWLIAPCCSAVTWVNKTSAPVTVVFDAVVGGSGRPIPPGGTYVYSPPGALSVAYHSGENPATKGVVQVNES